MRRFFGDVFLGDFCQFPVQLRSTSGSAWIKEEIEIWEPMITQIMAIFIGLTVVASGWPLIYAPIKLIIDDFFFGSPQADNRFRSGCCPRPAALEPRGDPEHGGPGRE